MPWPIIYAAVAGAARLAANPAARAAAVAAAKRAGSAFGRGVGRVCRRCVGGGAGGSAISRTINISTRQLQRKFKHAKVFGITGTPNSATLQAYRQAIQNHVASNATRAINGTYRGAQQVTHFVNPSTGVNVMRNSAGDFLSAFRLNPQQLTNVLTRGSL